jgi:NADH:ubiquinone oxidoreductase subunit K
MLLVLIGLIGLIINKKHALFSLLCLEIMALGLALMYMHVSTQIMDISGVIMALSIVVASGVESAIGLAVILGFFRAAGTISLLNKKRLKG